MVKKYQTSIEIDAQTKGFEAAQQKAAKLNETISKDIDAQIKGFAEAQKGSAAFNKSVDRLTKTFAGSSAELKKHVQTVMKEFANLDKLNLDDARKQINNLQDSLGGLSKEQEAVSAVLANMTDKASPAYKKLEEHLKAVNEETKNTERRISNLTKAYSAQFREADKAAKASAKASEEQARAQQMARGAFRQGLAQGGLPFPAPFLQRGPGMGAQIAGMAVGGLVSGGIKAGRAIGSSFGGVQGFAQALTAVPGIGTIAAGQLMAQASYAQQNIQYQQTKLGLAPYVGSYLDIRDMEKTKKAAREEATKLLATKRVAEAQLKQLSPGKAAQVIKSVEEGITSVAGFIEEFTGLQDKGIHSRKRSAEIQADKIKITSKGIKTSPLYQALFPETPKSVIKDEKIEVFKKGLEDINKELNKVWSKVKDPFPSIEKAGLNLMGVSAPEAAQFAGGIVQTGGGFMAGAKEQGLINLGMAANTLYGAGPEVTGAFLKATRRGGIAGSMGGALDFENVIVEGLKAGLEGSEMTVYLQSIAEGIQNFEQTGIPVNPKSITALAGDISKAGITGTRAITIAQGLTGGLQQMARGGARRGVDLLMLQLLGGYKGEGAEDYVRSRINVEKAMNQVNLGEGLQGIANQSNITNALKTILTSFTKGAGPGVQTAELMNILTGYGYTGSLEAVDWLRANIMEGKRNPEQLAAIEAEMAKRTKGAEEVQALTDKKGRLAFEQAAAERVGVIAGGARTAASITNAQIAAGAQFVGIVNKLERMATDTSTAFGNLSGPILNKAIDGLSVFGLTLIKVANKVGDAFSLPPPN